MRRRTAAQSLLLAGLLTACSKTKPKIEGVQIPVLMSDTGMDVAPDAPAVTLPPAMPLASWAQTLANAAHAPGNIATPLGLKTLWTADTGAKGGYRQPLTASPLVAQNAVFTLDADATIRAFPATGGEALWHFNTRPKHAGEQNLGGGLAWDNGTVYASTGYGEVVALNAASGSLLWRQPLSFPARTAPLVAGGLVAVITLDDLMQTFDATSGTPGWDFSASPGAPNTTAVGISGAPAYADGIVVGGFSNGLLAGIDAKSGTPLWEQSLAAGSGQTSSLDFSDIVASPVIADGVVYAINLSGSFMAVDLHSGVKVWTKGVAGTQAPMLSNGFAFLLDKSQRLYALHVDDGLVSWSTQIPGFRNMKKQKTPMLWKGPLLVNGTLVLVNDYAEIAFVDAITGSLRSVEKYAGFADIAPVAADGMLLALTRDAKLTAYG
jgi:outer membrane protein assembly factor BamB